MKTLPCSIFSSDKIPNIDSINTFKLMGLVENVDKDEIDALFLVHNYRKNKLVATTISRSEINAKSISSMLIKNMSHSLCNEEADAEAKNVLNTINSILEKVSYEEWYYSHDSVGFKVIDGLLVFKCDKLIYRDETKSSIYSGNYDIMPSGSVDVVIRLFNELLDADSPACNFLPIGAAATVKAFSNLQYKTNIYNFWIHAASANSSRGKSTIGSLLASFGARPFTDSLLQGMFLTLSDSQNSIITQMAGVSGYPFVLDESSTKDDAENLSSLIYTISDGRNKTRCKPDGSGITERKYFDTVVLSTGEAGILKGCDNFEGLKARCIEVSLDNYTSSGEESEHIIEVISENYGLITPMLATQLMQNSEHYNLIRKEWLARIRSRMKEEKIVLGIGNRLSGYLSIIMTATILLNETLNIDLNINSIYDFWYKHIIYLKSLDSNMFTQVYNRIKILISENYNKFYELNYINGVPALGEDFIGWAVDLSHYAEMNRRKVNGEYYDYIYVFPRDFLDEYLKRWGFADPYLAMKSLLSENLLRKSGGSSPIFYMDVESLPKIPTYGVFFQRGIPTVEGDKLFLEEDN